MYCKKCGSQVEENACFCDKCGALMDNNLFVYSRAKYFDSHLCSKKSKTLTIIAWVLVALLTGLLIFSLFSLIQAIPPILNEIAECETIGSVIETMEKLSGAPLGFTEEDILLFDANAKELIETIGLIFVITVVVSSVMALAVILLSIFAVYKKSFKCALWAAILCALSVSSILVFAVSFAIAVLANSWNKEYKKYCENPRMAEEDSNCNFS